MTTTMPIAENMPPELASALRQVRERFVTGLAPLILEIEALHEQIAEGRSPDAAATRMAFVAHRIRGLAGTVGIGTLGSRASAVEDQARAILRHGICTDPEGFEATVEALLDEMEDAVVDFS
ncbi:Hpt domain-containing protein [Celeribacter indicus]|uniref:HPt domain-containing protein n=1 Tax=Celeribacter indicus TaxID=1208324 RepID=A0A0B5DY63_9RHOB|nr:Hpt domain-containing protein [Celeribacter indicus]AJE48388.1 hypothetical protein P73_3673 [Celeribacter indicus]SDW74657.1 Hpt domain-containing protein [Celeribacter indicus]